MSSEGYADSFYDGPAYATVIGISKYKHGQEEGFKLKSNQFPNLNLAAKDAEDFVQLLKRNGFNENNIKPLYNEQATLAHIKYELDTLRKNCEECKKEGKAPLVIVYFSGHGWVDAENRHYLIPYEAERDNLFSTALLNKDLRGFLEKLDTDRLVVFLDACHSGGIGTEGAKGGVSPPYDFQRDLGEGMGRFIIASCQPDQQSWELPEKNNSIFTWHLLNLLSGNTDAFDKLDTDEIDLFHLYPVLRDEVKSTAKRLGKDQEPVANIEGTGIVLAINKRRKQIRIRKEEEERQALQKREFLRSVLKILESEFGNNKTIIIKLKLSDYVERYKQDDGYKDIYAVFDHFLEELGELDYTLRVTNCCKELFSAYNRTVALLHSSRQSHLQEPSRVVYERKSHVQEPSRAVDKFEDVGEERKILASENTVTVTPRIPPLPRDQVKPRRQLSTEAQDYILKEIMEKQGYFRVIRTLSELLSQPLGADDFIRKVLDIGKSNVDDKNLRDVLERIVGRFEECWNEPIADEPKRLSDFLMEKRQQ